MREKEMDRDDKTMRLLGFPTMFREFQPKMMGFAFHGKSWYFLRVPRALD